MNEILTPYYKRMAELLQETDKLIYLVIHIINFQLARHQFREKSVSNF